ncbi:Na+/H+ antiporter NhaA [Catellatospora citrea]|uniref:Na(+)/H(+) antiporter NhaA n=1 Tax=Catellatospora citrea TaxID=53366 RepID=A0A8J3KQU4_9ACTN|nr:Na+/H+ antiporter NhaA [Catellatospora citrea]RKE09170.1 sodium/proton antiporter (NhaA family) [Catellatospora citrea]GIF99654.1 Na(+)/H(+) antiporter NhaA [Catellatospora citrea]
MGDSRTRPKASPRQKRMQRRRAQAARSAAAEVVRFLRTEQIGGLVLLGATALALIIANSPLADAYQRLSAYTFGPQSLHLHLSVAQWAQDGLLTVFFVVAGLELKRELVVGELRSPRQAALPIAGAIGGMVVPSLLCFLIAFGAPGGADAWAVPVATDIAFALAVLAICARDLPPSLRVFLLSLAIVDDLGAILLIALVFTAHVAFLPLLGAAAVLVVYGLLQQFRFRGWWLYLPLALAAWALVHASGVHATIAGVAVGLLTRVKPDPGEHESPAEALEHRIQPISAGICVPLFAFFSAGIAISAGALGAIFTDRASLGVLLGLVVGKTVGVLLGAVVAVRSKLAQLPEALEWRDLVAVAVVTGCGFTVSLLIAELAFGYGEQQARIKGAVLLGSLIASLLAAVLLRRQVRVRAR